MSQLRVKGQALALVLIVVVVSIIVAFAISTRVIQDTQQQGEERASTRAETFAESAIDKLTLQIQGDEIKPLANGSPLEYAISTESPSGIPPANSPLEICDATSSDPAKQCSVQSLARVIFYKYVLQFKYFDAENLEIFMTSPSTTVAPPQANAAGIFLLLEPNDSYDETKSKILIKGFSRQNAVQELRPVAECLFNISQESGTCLPTILQVATAACPQVLLQTNTNTNVKFPPDNTNFLCLHIKINPAFQALYAIDLYRIRPLLVKAAGKNDVPYISVSATGDNVHDNYRLPEFHMSMITAGVYSGTTASDQQVFQQKTRLVLMHKTVPEVADYVLYNGSDQPIRK